MKNIPYSDLQVLENPVDGEKTGLSFYLRAFFLAVSSSHVFTTRIISILFIQIVILTIHVPISKILLFSPSLFLSLYIIYHVKKYTNKVCEENLFLRFVTHSPPFPSRFVAEQAFAKLLRKKVEIERRIEDEKKWQLEQAQRAKVDNIDVLFHEQIQILLAMPLDAPERDLFQKIAKDLESLKEKPSHLIERCLPLLIELSRRKTLTEDEKKFVNQVMMAVCAERTSYDMTKQINFDAEIQAAGKMLNMRGF